MKIRLIALLATELTLVVAFVIRQAQAVDTSVWIALIAGVVGLLTLLIQTYGQIQLQRIKTEQEKQAKAVAAQNTKLVEQATKVQEVHTLVNSSQTKMTDDMKVLLAEVNLLRGEKLEREKEDAKLVNQKLGAAEALLHPVVGDKPE